YSPGVGLMPDFIVGTDTTAPYPSPGYMGDGNAYEDDYWWNACRNPWRYASDYVLSGDTRWKTVTGRIVNFFQSQVNAAGGDVTVIGTGYGLNGSKITGGNDCAYMAPIMLGACIDSSYQSLVDALWNWNAARPVTGYYDSEIQLLSMAVAAGNWWSPLNVSASASTSTTSTGTTSPTPSTTSTTTTTAAATNILANGDFSSALTAWSNWGNSTVANGALNVGTNAGGVGQDVWSKLTPGTAYQLTGTANVTVSGTEGVFVGVQLMDSSGAVLVNQTQLVSATASTAVSVAFTAPTGVASGYVYVWKNANSAIGVVDNLSLVAV
ncbi:MAG TPA: carbohydrate binding domain-containing protein, partial [Ramlibacter sp.]|nr:carbohydrate binding domain-containing protein [Ramlibacter sp.]